MGAGELIALVNGRGVYERADHGEDAADLVFSEHLRQAASGERVSESVVRRELDLLRSEFPGEKAFDDVLRGSGLTRESLRSLVTEHHQQRQWIEAQIAPAVPATEQEARQFYDEHRHEFVKPVRFRARHVFLAAHAATRPEVIEANRKGIATVTTRLVKGEDFAQLAAEASEDEATKFNGGDLGFFAADRMPPEFVREVQKLRVRQTSPPFRSHLGFHIVRLTDFAPAESLPFEVVRTEIGIRLAKEKRAYAIHGMRDQPGFAEFIRRTE